MGQCYTILSIDILTGERQHAESHHPVRLPASFPSSPDTACTKPITSELIICPCGHNSQGLFDVESGITSLVRTQSKVHSWDDP